MSASLYAAYENIRRVEERGAASPGELKGLSEVLCRLWGTSFAGDLIDERQTQFNDLIGWLTVETGRLLSKPIGVVASKVAIPGAMRWVLTSNILSPLQLRPWFHFGVI